MNPDQSKSQEKTAEQPVSGQSKPQQLQGFSYLTRKAEKLTTALYMVTDILGDKEPLKWKAREAGVELLSDITVAGATGASERMSILRTTLKKIERVVSFIEIAVSARMISEMNSGVLKKEYLLLKDNVEAEWQHTHDRSRQVLTEHFFDVPRDVAVLTPPTAPVAEIKSQASADNKGYSSALGGASLVVPVPLIENKNIPRQTFTPTPALAPIPVVRTAQTPTFTPSQNIEGAGIKSVSLDATRITTPVRPIIVDREIAAHFSRNDFGRDDRRKIILALLKQKPSVIVGDIAKSIPGVSEKTIQRELLAMVAENILIKRGERRWSTYSLRND